jgi:hypothetical protein
VHKLKHADAGLAGRFTEGPALRSREVDWYRDHRLSDVDDLTLPSLVSEVSKHLGNYVDGLSRPPTDMKGTFPTQCHFR